MLSLRCFRQQVCYTSFSHIHSAAWISGKFTEGWLCNYFQQTLGGFGKITMIYPTSWETFFSFVCFVFFFWGVLCCVGFFFLRFSVLFVCLFLPCLQWWFKGIESGNAGRGEESAHCKSSVPVIWIADSRWDKRSMLGKDGKKMPYVIFSDVESGGGFLNDGDYHQFILDGFHDGRLWGQICGGQNKRNLTVRGESGVSWLNYI